MADLIFPNTFLRQYSGPLDKDLVFSTTAERIQYTSNPRRYAGQIVYDEEARQVFVLTPDNSATVWAALTGTSFTLSEAITGTTATFSSYVSAPALSGTFYGDGSNLTGITVAFPQQKVRDQSFASNITYTLLSSDVNGILTLSNSTYDTIITIEPTLQSLCEIGTQVELIQLGTGTITISSTIDPTTIISKSSRYKLDGQYSSATLVKISNTTWHLGGDIIT